MKHLKTYKIYENKDEIDIEEIFYLFLEHADEYYLEKVEDVYDMESVDGGGYYSITNDEVHKSFFYNTTMGAPDQDTSFKIPINTPTSDILSRISRGKNIDCVHIHVILSTIRDESNDSDDLTEEEALRNKKFENDIKDLNRKLIYLGYTSKLHIEDYDNPISKYEYSIYIVKNKNK